MKLGEVAEIKTGLVLNRKKAACAGTAFKYKVLTLKSLKKNGVINSDELEDFYSEEPLGEGYITKIGDIILRLSDPNTVAYIDQSNKNILVPSQFCILRRKSGIYNFEFLAWYLNSETVKKNLKKSSIGSTLAIVTTGYLNKLPVDRISAAKQDMIIQIIRLKNRELNLMEALIAEKEKLYDGLVDKVLKANTSRSNNDKTRKNQ